MQYQAVSELQKEKVFLSQFKKFNPKNIEYPIFRNDKYHIT